MFDTYNSRHRENVLQIQSTRSNATLATTSKSNVPIVCDPGFTVTILPPWQLGEIGGMWK